MCHTLSMRRMAGDSSKNLKENTNYVPIDMTMAALDKQELAKQSAERILELIEQNDEESGKDIILKQQLHVGETT